MTLLLYERSYFYKLLIFTLKQDQSNIFCEFSILIRISFTIYALWRQLWLLNFNFNSHIMRYICLSTSVVTSLNFLFVSVSVHHGQDCWWFDKLSFVLSVTQCLYSPCAQQHHTIGAWFEEHCPLCPTRGKGQDIYKSNWHNLSIFALQL